MWFGLGIVTYAVVHPVAQGGWTSWTIHWSTVIGLAALGGVYIWGARRLQAQAAATRVEPPVVRRSQQIAFFSGLLPYFPALGTGYSDLFAFAILILILIFRPAGLLGKKVDEKV